MSMQLIGQRLEQLRSELAGPGEKKWSRAKLAAATGITLNALTQLELAGAGTISTLLTLALFYRERGYNLAWILLVDNSTISKRQVENTKAVAVEEVLKKVNELRDRLQLRLTELIEALAD